jgi:hypothetical protein
MKTYECYAPELDRWTINYPRIQIEAVDSFTARMEYARRYGIAIVEVVAIKIMEAA